MPARWYYRHDGSEFGPVALPQLAQLASSGQIQLNDWVREGESNPWQPLAKSPEVLAAVSAAPAASPAKRPAPKPRTTPPLPTALAPPRPAAPVVAKPLAPRSAKPTPPPPPAVATVKAVAVAPAPPPTHLAQRVHKKSSGATLGVALAGAGGIVAIVVLAIMASMGDSSTPVAASLATKKDGTSKPSSKDDTSPAALLPAQVNMTAAIRNWRDAKVKGGLRDLISFEIKRVAWTGTTASTDDEGAIDQPGRLVVELAITNTSAAPLAYKSWDSSGKTGAWLVDSDLKIAGTPDGSGKELTLAPQQTVVESIEFRTSTQDHAELRLVLPYAAVERTGQWGYVLDGATLRGEAQNKPISTVAKGGAGTPPPTPLAPQAEPIVIESAVMPEPGVAASAAPAVDDGEPTEDIRDLVKRSKAMDKPSAPKSE